MKNKRYIYESETLSYIECEEKEIELFEVKEIGIIDWKTLTSIMDDTPRENIKSLGKCKIMISKE